MNKGIRVLTVFMWLLFLGVFAVICYLSFQNGDAAKEIDRIFVDKVVTFLYAGDNLNSIQLADKTRIIRQFGRFVLFVVLGILGTLTIHLTFYKINWFFRTIIAVIALVAIAVFTERFKMYLPTRHFSEAELILSVEGVLLGFIFVSVVSFVFGIFYFFIKKIFNKRR